MPTHYHGNPETVRALDTFIKLTRATESLTARLNRRGTIRPLSPSQFAVLEALYYLGPLLQGQVSAKVLKSTGNITLVIDNLEKQRLVQRTRESADRREVTIHLTETGKKMIERIFPDHARAICEEINVLTPEEQSTLARLCLKLGKAAAMIEILLRVCAFVVGAALVVGTFYSALSTFVVPRAVQSQLNRLVFALLRRAFEIPLKFAHDFERRDAIMAYYAPVGLMLLVPTWYTLVALGYTGIYWGLGGQGWVQDFRLSGSSLLTLGFASSENFPINVLMFSEATLGLTLVALLIAYLPTMYAAFARREQAVNLLEVRAGNPPSAIEMILRYNRIHGLDRLNDYWIFWEDWFADVEQTHTVLPALVFFRSTRAQNSWVTAAATVLDAAALTLSSVDVPATASAQLCIRAGFIAFRRIVDYFDVAYPADPHFPQDPISISREEFETALDQLAKGGVPLKADRDQAWLSYAGWRVNYDVVLLALCSLTMAPKAPWSSDRAPHTGLPALMNWKKP